MQDRLRDLMIGLVALLVGALAISALYPPAPPAQAQESIRQGDALSDIGAGTPSWTGAISCPSTGTQFFYFDNPSNPSAADYMLFADGTNLLVKNMTADTEATCCWLGDSASTIGAQTSTATALQVDGAAGGSCITISGKAKEPHKWKYNAWASTTPGYMAGVCEVASTHVRSDVFAVHKICTNEADCDNIAGTAASGTCGVASAVLTSIKQLRGVLLGCRCSATAELRAELKR